MPYDDRLAERIRELLQGRRHVIERKMFGGLAFMYRGRMCCGIVGNDLVVRVASDEFPAVMRRKHVRPMDFTGKPLKRRFQNRLQRGLAPTRGERPASARVTPTRVVTLPSC